MAEIEYTETDERGLDQIAPLWQKLIDYHGELSEPLGELSQENLYRTEAGTVR